jgi:hypothetical protein
MSNTEYADWGDLFYAISPYSWAYVGIGIALAASVIGAAWYIVTYKIGVSLFLVQVYSELLLKHLELDLRT